MSGNRLGNSVFWIYPNGMAAPFPFQKAPGKAKTALQIAALHPTNIFS